MLRILIADDYPIVRLGVRRLIEGRLGWQVCGEARDGEEALALALRVKPDIAILDTPMPQMNSMALTRELMAEHPKLRVLLFAMHDDDNTMHTGVAAGARGIILKTDDEKYLAAAIAALAANRSYFSPPVREILLKRSVTRGNRSRLESFTPRELEVAQLIAEGEPNKGVARRLGLSVKTVEAHRCSILRKADVHTVGGFVRFAIKHHLIDA